MGLSPNIVRTLLYAKKMGADFSRTLMIGRQRLHLSPEELRRQLASFGYSPTPALIKGFFDEAQGYAEPLLRYLGAGQTHSLDYSDYEGAAHVHDLNQELPTELQQQYTLVFDGGSLEHIFNFPMALKNCMELLALDGWYLSVNPANNFFGHGFYQFSPELFFNIFTPDNGFQLREVAVFEDAPRTRWYHAHDPAAVGTRTTLVNNRPTQIFVLAQRCVLVQPLQKPPQQGYYETMWQPSGEVIPPHSSLRQAARRLPGPLLRLAVWLLRRQYFNPRFFTPFDPTH